MGVAVEVRRGRRGVCSVPVERRAVGQSFIVAVLGGVDGFEGRGLGVRV